MCADREQTGSSCNHRDLCCDFQCAHTQSFIKTRAAWFNIAILLESALLPQLTSALLVPAGGFFNRSGSAVILLHARASEPFSGHVLRAHELEMNGVRKHVCEHQFTGGSSTF